MDVILGIIALILLVFKLLSPSGRLKSKGDCIPGIPPWPLVGNAFHYHMVGTRTLPELFESKKKYGNTFRIWIGPTLHVFLNHPDDLQMVLTSQSHITKSGLYSVLTNWLGTGLLLSTGDLWHRRRKAITPTFHFKVLDDFVAIFSKCADILVKCLMDKVGKESFIITPYLSNCALDTVSESAMGIKLEAQEKPKLDYVSTLREFSKSMGKKANYPWMAVEPLYTLSGRRYMERNCLKILHALPEQVLKAKKLATITDNNKEQVDEFGTKKRKAFLELLLNMKDCEAFKSDQDILDEVTTFMFEAHDTSTSALTFTLWLLGKHMEIQENVFQEVQSIYPVNAEELKIDDFKKMKYLERVIKESLRLYPPVPIIGRSLEEDLVIPSSGLTIPAGAAIYLPIAIIHMDPHYFPDPEKFNPDRFLEEQKHPFAYIPFSAGPRNCIGQKFAMLEMKTILAKLIMNYKICSEENITLNSQLVLRSVNGPKVSLIHR